MLLIGGDTKARLVGSEIELPPCANAKLPRQINCRAGVVPASLNHQAAQLDGTLELVTMYTWVSTSGMLRSITPARLAEPASHIEHVSQLTT